MQCAQCGRFFKTSSTGRPAKYCSGKCRVAAHRKHQDQPESERQQPVTITLPGNKTPVKTSIPGDVLTRETFESMCDGRLVDEYRFARDILHHAMQSGDTPAASLAALSKQYLEIVNRLAGLADAATGQSPSVESSVSLDSVFTPDAG